MKKVALIGLYAFSTLYAVDGQLESMKAKREEIKKDITALQDKASELEKRKTVLLQEKTEQPELSVQIDAQIAVAERGYTQTRTDLEAMQFLLQNTNTAIAAMEAQTSSAPAPASSPTVSPEKSEAGE